MRTLQTVLEEMRAHGSAVAVHAFTDAGEATVGYGELCATADRVGAGLRRRLGLRPGDRAAICAPNRLAWVQVRLGMVAAAVTAVPLDDMGTADDVARALANSEATVLFTVRELLPRLAPLRDRTGVRLVLLDDGAEGDVPSWRTLMEEPDGERPSAAPDDIAAIIYTSGTTGAAKGVPLTHRNILTNIDSMAAGGYAGPGDRVLLPLPLHHAYPFIVGLMLPFSLGATVVLPRGVAGPDIVAALKDGHATVMIGVPRLYEAFAQGVSAKLGPLRPLLRLSVAAKRRWNLDLGRALMRPVRRKIAPDLRLLGSGGAKLDPEVAWTLTGLGFETLSGYGLVETASVSTYNRRGRARIGTEGLPGDGVELRIAAPESDGGDGEIQIRGPHVFAGYHKNPEATAESFTGDGWFRTGDLGRLEPDGSLVVSGRRKEIIVLAGGKKLAPEEVEAALCAGPYIREAGVFEDNGALRAVVVPEIGALKSAASGRIDQVLRIAVAEAGAALPPYKRVAGYRVVAEPLPKTRLGKLRRFALPGLYARAAAAERIERTLTEQESTWRDSPNGRRVLAILARRYPGETITLDTSPQLDLGVDSLGWLELAAEIETTTGAAIDEAALSRIMTVGDLLREVAEAPALAPKPVRAAGGFTPQGARGVQRAVGFALYAVLRTAMRLLFRMRVTGTFPDGPGPYMVIANHVSDLDPFAVAAAMPWRFVSRSWWSIENSRLPGGAAGRFLAGAAQFFTVDDTRPSETLGKAESVLKAGDNLVWFPESWRSPDGTLQEFLRGVGVLANDCRPIVVPVWIEGTFEALPRQRRWPRLVPVRLRIGAPIAPEAYLPAAEDDAAATARALRDRLVTVADAA